MEFILQPWHLLILALSALINHEQKKVIEYLIWGGSSARSQVFDADRWGISGLTKNDFWFKTLQKSCLKN